MRSCCWPRCSSRYGSHRPVAFSRPVSALVSALSRLFTFVSSQNSLRTLWPLFYLSLCPLALHSLPAANSVLLALFRLPSDLGRRSCRLLHPSLVAASSQRSLPLPWPFRFACTHACMSMTLLSLPSVSLVVVIPLCRRTRRGVARLHILWPRMCIGSLCRYRSRYLSRCSRHVRVVFVRLPRLTLWHLLHACPCDPLCP